MDIQHTIYFVLGPPNVITLAVDHRLSSVIECCPLKPEIQGANTSPGRFALLFTLCVDLHMSGGSYIFKIQKE